MNTTGSKNRFRNGVEVVFKWYARVIILTGMPLVTVGIVWLVEHDQRERTTVGLFATFVLATLGLVLTKSDIGKWCGTVYIGFSALVAILVALVWMVGVWAEILSTTRGILFAILFVLFWIALDNSKKQRNSR